MEPARCPHSPHPDSRLSLDDHGDQRRAGSRISTLRLRGAIWERARGRQRATGRARRRRNRARKYFSYDKAVELESPARARRTGFRSEPRKTRARACGSLSHSYPVCISTRRRPGSARSKWQCPLRPRRHFARHLESDGSSRGSRQVPGHRTFGRQLKRSEAPLRICES